MISIAGFPKPVTFTTAEMVVKVAKLHGHPLEVQDGAGHASVSPVQAFLITRLCKNQDWQLGWGVATDQSIWEWLARKAAAGVIQRTPWNIMSNKDLAEDVGVNVTKFKITDMR